MPSPIGHFITSCIYARKIKSPNSQDNHVILFLSIMFVSMIQDVDKLYPFLFGIHGEHKELSHAFILSPIGGVIIGIVFHRFCNRKFLRGFVWGMSVWVTHICLDMLSSVTGPKIFLPFLDNRCTFPIHTLPVAEPYIGSFFFNATAISFEVAIFVGLYVIITKPEWAKRLIVRIIVIILFCFCLLGGFRQSNYRVEFFSDYTDEDNAWYESNLDELSPLHFALFNEIER